MNNKDKNSLQQDLSNKEKLIKLLAAKKRTERIEAEKKIVSCDRNNPLLTSFAQQRLWFIDRMQPGSIAYNMPMAIRIKGQFDVSIAEQVICEIIQRHETLRTTFIETDGVPYQNINVQFDFKLMVHDLSALNQIKQEQEIKELTDKELSQPFDLKNDLMIRVQFLNLSNEAKTPLGILLFNMHHIASDGWSMGLLFKEFATLYKAKILGQTATLPKLVIQYADYASWQRQWLDGPLLDQQLSYWKKQLKDVPTTHALPLSAPRPKNKSHLGAVISGHMPTKVSQQLELLAKERHVTLFMLLHAALALVLCRSSNTNECVIGTPVANRLRQELEPLIGFFVNTSILRTNTEYSTFYDYLEHIKQINIDAQANQDVPFEYLVEHCQVTRSTKHTPLFQIMFSIGGVDENVEIDIPGLHFSSQSNGDFIAKFDLDINFQINANGIDLFWVYDCSIFEKTQIEQLNLHVMTVLGRLIKNPSTKMNQLSMLDDSEQTELLKLANDSMIKPFVDQSIHSLFQAKVEQQPHHTAITSEGQSISYQQLNRKANQLAHELQLRGVRTDSLVGLCLEHSIDMVIAMLAILKAGGAYLPLDPTYPEARLAYIIEDSGVALILAHFDSNQFEWSKTIDCIYLDEKTQQSIWQQHSTDNLSTKVNNTSTDLAYVIYTSGSTGKPKGVLIEHQGLVNRMEAFKEFLTLDSSDVVPSIASFAFDISLLELIYPLLCGAQVKLLTKAVIQDMLLLSKHIQNCTFIHMVPSLAAAWLDHVNDQNCKPSVLKYFATGGDKVPSELLLELDDSLDSAHIMQFYGPTEAVLFGVCNQSISVNNTSLGKAINNTRLYILDTQNMLLPTGAIGELHMGGPSIARGYLNQDELTAERFINNPFIKSEKLYKTGDLVRYQTDGQLQFIGRTDEQVKVRGFRIELGEIESCLNSCQSVKQSLVLTQKDDTQATFLVAYIVAHESEVDTNLDFIGYIKTTLKSLLPNYMIPSKFVHLESMPLNANGKIDTKILADSTSFTPQKQFIVANTKTEESLVSIWAKLLKINPNDVSTNEDFFQIGGHSLLAVRLVAEIRKELKKEIPIKLIFEFTQIKQLADEIDRSNSIKLRSEIKPVKRTSNTFTMSYAQKQLWFIDQMNGGSAHYNMPMAMRMDGDFNIEIAEQAFKQIIQRHETLRTIFISDEKETLQVVVEDVDFEVTRIDLSTLNKVNQDKQIEQVIVNDAQTSFNLSQDLMLRVSYLGLGDADGVLLFNMHHIASDGWSMGLLMKEFIQLYRAGIEGKDNPLQPLAIQYVDYTEWQRNWLKDKTLVSQLNYWDRQLADLPQVHNLPLDHERPAHQTFGGEVYDFKINIQTLNKLDVIGKDNNATLFMVIHAAFAIVLARYSNSNDIVIGTPVANRLQKELEELIGFFVNTLVLRVDCSGDPSFKKFLKQIKNTNLDAQDNQDVPFEHLVDRLNPNRSTSHNALFQIMLNMNTNEKVELTLPNVTLSPQSNEEITAKFDLQLNAVAVYEKAIEKGLNCSFIYNTDLFSTITIERMAKSMQLLLDGIAIDATQKISQLPILNDTEAKYLLHKLNDTQTDYPKALCFHELFEQQVEKTPDNIAVIFEDHSLTYSELNDQSNQVAHYLIDKGFQVGKRVGVYLDRSLELLPVMLGIMKSGSSYVALEPSHPKDRLSYIIKDAEIDLIVLTSDLINKIASINIEKLLIEKSINGVTTLKKYATHNLNLNIPLNNEIYTLYTSGSTGQPKGVMINHKGLSNYIHYAINEYFNSEISGSIVSSPLCFDATITTLLTPLCVGKSVEVLPNSDETISLLSARLFAQSKPLLFKITPAHLEALTHHQQKNPPQTNHQIVVGGEQLSFDLIKKWKSQLLPSAIFINEYGPTETVVGCCVFKIKSQQDLTAITTASVPIGRPINNTQLYVMNDSFGLQAKGSIGELYIGGHGVSNGYINNRKLTKRSFINNPFAKGSLYKTGDLVKYLEDDTLLFIGRIDDQVNIRGYRIELGEIEQQLIAHEDVKSSMALVTEEQKIVAYFTTDSPTKELKLISNIHSFLQNHLPSYMVPSSLIHIEQWPMTENGKINKSKLPSPKDNNSTDIYQAANNQTESVLVEIWSKLLKLKPDSLSVTANFFSLGGDSILSIQMVSRAAKMGLYCSVKDLFDTQNIRSLAKKLNKISKVQAPQNASIGRMSLLPTHHRFFNNPVDLHHYNQSVLLNTPENFNSKDLFQIIRELYQRHDGLRLKFYQENQQWIAEYMPLKEQLIKQSIIHKELEAGFDKGGENEFNLIQKSLSLETGELFKVLYLTSRTEGTGRLLLVVHHLLIDDFSWSILLEDLEFIYQQILQKKIVKMPDKTSSYQQWGEYLKNYTNNLMPDAEKTFWLKTNQTPVTNINQCALRETHSIGVDIQTVEFSLNEQQTRELLKQCNEAYRTNINELLLSGLFRAFNLATAQCTLRILLESHGRESLTDAIDLSQTIGAFTSVYPLILAVNDTDSIEDIICTTKEQYRKTPNNGIGFGLIRYLSKDESLLSMDDTDMIFNYLGQFDQMENDNNHFTMATENSGINMSERRIGQQAASITGAVISNCLSFQLRFNANKYQLEKMQKLMHHFDDSLKCIINHCISIKVGVLTPSDFPLAKTDRQQLRNWASILDIEDLYPATGLQQGLLFHSMISAGEYVSQTLIKFRHIDVEALKKAWQFIVNRHTILRTAYVGFETGNPHQLISKYATLPWKALDISHLTKQAQSQKIEEIRVEDKKTNFDLQSPPLMRITIFNLGKGSQQVIWSHHHALMDGWSLPLLFSEVTDCYQTFKAGNEPKLKSPISFKQYIQWLSEQDHNKADTYWQSQLSKIKNPTPLPLAKTHSTDSAEHTIKSQRVFFGEEKNQQLIKLAQANQTTVNVIVQAAWALLLSRYSGESQVVYGTVSSGRPANLIGVEEIIGLFINTVPVVVEVDNNISLSKWLNNIHSAQTERESFSYVPLQHIQKFTKIKQRLFDSIFVFQNFPTDAEIENQQKNSPIHLEEVLSFSNTDYDICVIANQDKTLVIDLKFQSSRFSEDSIIQICNHLEQIINGLIKPSDDLPDDKLISHIDVLSEKEKHHLLYELNQTQVPYPNDILIHKLFEHQVNQTPQALALVFENQEITYDQLNKSANQLAHHLIKIGIETNQLVAIHMDRSIDMIVSIMAIIKAGAGYVPLDPNYPKARLQSMLESCKAVALITQSQAKHIFQSIESVEIITIDDPKITSLLQTQATDNPALKHNPKDLAYVIFTSGSTGIPKAVMVEHWALVNSTLARIDTYPDMEAFLLLSSISFDSSVAGIFGSLCNGNKLCIASTRMNSDVKELLDFIKNQQVSHMLTVPSFYRVIIDLDHDKVISALDVVIVAGEHCSNVLIQKHYLTYENTKLFNEYGPTEGTVWSTYTELSANQSSHIGKPIANVQVYILDTQLNLAPKGAIGELFIGGRNLSQGYLHNKILSDESFIKIKALAGQNLYKTGDLVRYDKDDNIHFIGRCDQQVKIRGYRIDTNEIEDQIMKSSELNACSVIAMTNADTGHQFLVAYVVFDQPITMKHELFRKKLNQNLKKILPPHMIPSHIEYLEKLPLSVNGKVDIRKLKDLSLLSKGNHSYTQPKTKTEIEMTTIWSQLLCIKVELISVEANFYDLGGDSLLSLQLLSRINEQFNARLYIKDILENPTIKLLATSIQQEIKNTTISVNSVVKLNNAKSSKNLFVVHPIVGFVSGYREFAQQLKNDLNVYGVQAPYNYQHQFRFKSMIEIADFYANGIRNIQPEGPYILSGWSAGGQIAYYIANALQEMGQEIEYLGMIESAVISDIYDEVTSIEALDFVLTMLLKESEQAKTIKENIIGSISIEESEDKAIDICSKLLADYNIDHRNDIAMNQLFLSSGVDFITAKRNKVRLKLIETVRIFTSESRTKQEKREYLLDWQRQFNEEIKHQDLKTKHSTMMEGDSLQNIVKTIRKDLKYLNTLSSHK